MIEKRKAFTKMQRIKKILAYSITFIFTVVLISQAAEIPASAKTENQSIVNRNISEATVLKIEKEFHPKIEDIFSKIEAIKEKADNETAQLDEGKEKEKEKENTKMKSVKKNKTEKSNAVKTDENEKIKESVDEEIASSEENKETNKEEQDAVAEKEKDTVDENDLMLLAKLIYLENGSGSDEVQLLTGNVVLNRVASKKYPNTIKEVIYQKGQYSVSSKIKSTKPSERAIKNAKRLLEGERFCPSNVVYQSRFKQGSGVYKKINGEYFCYL